MPQQQQQQQQQSAAVYHEFGGPIRIETIPIPICPIDGVLIRVKAVGVCRSDWHGWKGHDSDILQHGLPFVPGHEVCGIIVEIGKQLQQRGLNNSSSSSSSSSSSTGNSQKLCVGDRVAVPFILSCGTCRYCQHYDQSTVCTAQKQPGFTQYGGFAEYMAIPRAERNLAIIPYNVTYSQAAALGCRFTTAYRAVLQQGRLSLTNQDTSIAIFGCGGLGLSCIMWAVTTNCPIIIAIDVSDAALHKAKQLGATHSINTRNMDTAKVRRHVEEIVQNDGVDVSIEASGFISACENAIHCTRRGGRMVQVGLLSSPSGHSQQQPQYPIIPMNMIAGKEIELIGSHGFSATDLPVILDMVSRNVIDPALLIEREVTLEEGAKAIEDMDHSSPLGIIMVTKFPNETSQKSRL